MSRIGRAPITILDGVNVRLEDNFIHVYNDKNVIKIFIPKYIDVSILSNSITLQFVGNNKEKPMYGTTRQLINNAINGIKNGYTVSLKLFGVGYEVEDKGDKLRFKIGFSHEILWQKHESIEYTVLNRNSFKISGINKEIVNQEAAKIRSLKKPDVYGGKGIRYEGEKLSLREKKKV